MKEFLDAVRNATNFSGRASQRQYWMFFLFYVLLYIPLALIPLFVSEDFALFAGLPSLVYALAMILPSLSVGVRRLHDTDRSGWWLLLSLIPIAGLYVLYLMIIRGTEGPNRFGLPVARTAPNAI